MRLEIRIKELARERAMTLASIAKKLGMPRSNMSAIASGGRGASLKLLKKISLILGCGLDDVILEEKHALVFKDKKLQNLLTDVENRNYDGIDKTWVDGVMLAHKMHYGAARKT